MTPEELIAELVWYAGNQEKTGLAPNSRWDLRVECAKALFVRAECAEMALAEIQRLIPIGGMIRVSDLTKIMGIIKAYKEASCLNPSRG